MIDHEKQLNLNILVNHVDKIARNRGLGVRMIDIDGITYSSLNDIVTVLCDCKSAQETINIIAAVKKSKGNGDLMKQLVIKKHKFGGEGHSTPIITASQCIQLISILPKRGHPLVEFLQGQQIELQMRAHSGNKELLAEMMRISKAIDSGSIPNNTFIHACHTELEKKPKIAANAVSNKLQNNAEIIYFDEDNNTSDNDSNYNSEHESDIDGKSPAVVQNTIDTAVTTSSNISQTSEIDLALEQPKCTVMTTTVTSLASLIRGPPNETAEEKKLRMMILNIEMNKIQIESAKAEAEIRRLHSDAAKKEISVLKSMKGISDSIQEQANRSINNLMNSNPVDGRDNVRRLDMLENERRLLQSSQNFNHEIISCLSNVKPGMAVNRITASTQPLAIENGSIESPRAPAPAIQLQPPRREITFEDIGRSMGYTTAWIQKYRSQIGKNAASRYYDAHETQPPKHTALVYGKKCLVNTYYEGDEEVIREAIEAIAERFPPPRPRRRRNRVIRADEVLDDDEEPENEEDNNNDE